MTSTMTDTGELVRAFITALSPAARAAVVNHMGIDGNRVILISTAARDHGWTAHELAAECNRNLNVSNKAAVITHRLKECAAGKPRPAPTGPAKFVQPKPWCRDELCQEQGRWRLHPDTLTPIGHCQCWTEPT